MTLTPLSSAAMSAMKMSRLQPARRPSAPTKMLRTVKDLRGREAPGSVGPAADSAARWSRDLRGRARRLLMSRDYIRKQRLAGGDWWPTQAMRK